MNSKFNRSLALLIVPVALLAGCAAPRQAAPHVAVMPAPGKPFEVFAAEESYCRNYAEQSTGGASPAGAQTDSVASSAIVGTAIGAVAGSALFGRHGAATGAGMGLIVGTSAGANAGNMSARDIQRRYDIAYQQCMYAKGNQIPGINGGYRPPPAPAPVSAPPQNYAPPPPPSGAYPAPPGAGTPPPGQAPSGYYPPPAPNR